ncbi:inositol monophosphatase family protein [Streptomyces sp. NPDC101733]|uniref:inositol monophosphatase family protein n=1 Tax=unclassified Streptomyces TaxID=2593676 RepID=UPI0038177366
MSTAMPFDVDTTLMSDVTVAVKTAGLTLLDRYTPHARGVSLDEIVQETHANDEAVLDVLREPLLRARPGARWAEDELAGGALPPGEWWVVDPAEGNINHVHGMEEWAVTATLVRDDQPVLTVVHQPLKVSAKTDLGGALIGTGQAEPGEDERTLRRIGDSVTAMLINGLVVRVSVPATRDAGDGLPGDLCHPGGSLAEQLQDAPRHPCGQDAQHHVVRGHTAPETLAALPTVHVSGNDQDRARVISWAPGTDHRGASPS